MPRAQHCKASCKGNSKNVVEFLFVNVIREFGIQQLSYASSRESNFFMSQTLNRPLHEELSLTLSPF